jgi:hypothetical protein
MWVYVGILRLAGPGARVSESGFQMGPVTQGRRRVRSPPSRLGRSRHGHGWHARRPATVTPSQAPARGSAAPRPPPPGPPSRAAGGPRRSECSAAQCSVPGPLARHYHDASLSESDRASDPPSHHAARCHRDGDPAPMIIGGRPG